MWYESGIDVSLVDVQLRMNLTAAFQSESAAVPVTSADRHFKEGAKQQNAGQIFLFSVIW